MKVHHLNCGSFCPLLGGEAVCHCLLLETAAHGLVLIDTGIGHHVSEDPRRRMSLMNRWTLRPRFTLEESALTQLGALGFSPDDVRHVVLTHLDVDHAGGLRDFPRATVHLYAPERASVERAPVDPRYDAALWRHVARWETYEDGEAWLGFRAARDLRGLPPEVLLVPLVGHTRGHTGVAVEARGRWLLHAGDAYLDPVELDPGRTAPWATRLAARVTSALPAARRENLERLRELRRTQEIVSVFSAHSPEEYRALSARAGAR
ncbi:MBL fold metallo-hydrolase [Sorangium sp. So ce726]|uniref:MBL fold metallo-hydrolase n=1 Tax=Sorangium sp. So ce726 TaxID=3133319 RepID=UPI003F6272FC